MVYDVRPYAKELKDADQAIARFWEEDSRVRQNAELRPSVIAQRRAQLADMTRQTVAVTFDAMIDQAAAAAKQSPQPEPTLDAAGKSGPTGEPATGMSLHPSMRPGYGSWWTMW
jgi:hypothetical protein